jgi:hypothetical protein
MWNWLKKTFIKKPVKKSFTIGEAAQILGCDKSQVCQLIYNKELKYACDKSYNFTIPREHLYDYIDGVNHAFECE